MLEVLFGVFFVLHGIVHLLYAGHSQRMFEMKPGMTWPDGSWAFSRLLGDALTRQVDTAALVAAAVGFLVAGIGLFFGAGWWRGMAVGAAAFSSLLYLLMWDGKMQSLDGQGFVGILINVAIVVVLLVFKWPPVK